MKKKSNNTQQSYVMVKPRFANNKDLIIEIKNRLTKVGVKVLKEDYINYDRDLAKEHYAEHVGKDFYPPLEDYIVSDICYGMVVEGKNAISKIREIVGSTKEPAEGTIRHDIPIMFKLESSTRENVIHASDSEQSAKREIEIFEKAVEKNAELNR